MKILVIAMAGIGDALIATPLIHELRANFPDATIDALVLWAGSKDLLENNPHLNRVHQKNLINAGKLEGLKFLWSLRRNRLRRFHQHASAAANSLSHRRAHRRRAGAHQPRIRMLSAGSTAGW